MKKFKFPIQNLLIKFALKIPDKKIDESHVKTFIKATI